MRLKIMMTTLITWVRQLSSVAFVLALTSMATFADEVKLDRLFEALYATDDVQRGQELTNQIWSEWHQVDDSDVRERFEQGLGLMGEGQYKRAIAAFDDVISMAPEFAEGWNKRATVYYQLGDFEHSAADVKETLKREPRHFGALSGLGLLYLGMDRPQAAKKAFEEALAANPHLTGPRENIRYIEQLIENFNKDKKKKAI